MKKQHVSTEIVEYLEKAIKVKVTMMVQDKDGNVKKEVTYKLLDYDKPTDWC